MTNHNDQERALFEAAYKAACLARPVPRFADAIFAKDHCGDYVSVELQNAWWAWQARAQLPAGGAVPEAVEVAAYITRPSRMTMDGWEDGDEYAVIASEASEADKRYDVPLMTVAQHNRIVAMLAAAPHPVSGEHNDTVGELVSALEACRKELLLMIDKHNVRDESDGSWLYDHQTVCEADAALADYRAQQGEKS